MSWGLTAGEDAPGLGQGWGSLLGSGVMWGWGSFIDHVLHSISDEVTLRVSSMSMQCNASEKACDHGNRRESRPVRELGSCNQKVPWVIMGWLSEKRSLMTEWTLFTEYIQLEPELQPPPSPRHLVPHHEEPISK